MAGKRAKCKACGHVFRIGPPAPKPDNPPKVAEKLKEAYSHDLGIAGAFAKPPPAALSPAAAKLARMMKVFSWIQLRWWMLLVCLGYAVVIGLGASHWPGIWKDSLWIFPALACVLLPLGIIHTSARALMAHDDERISFGDLLLINLQFVLAVFLRLGSLAYKRTLLRPDQYRRFFRQVLIVMLQASCLAGVSGVLLAAQSVSKSAPSWDRTQRAIQNFLDDSHRHRHQAGGDQDTP